MLHHLKLIISEIKEKNYKAVLLLLYQLLKKLIKILVDFTILLSLKVYHLFVFDKEKMDRIASGNDRSVRKVLFGFRFKYLVLIGSLLIISLSLFSYILYYNQVEDFKDQVKQNSENTIKMLSVNVRDYLGNDPAITKTAKKRYYRNIKKVIKNIKKEEKDIISIYIVDTNRRIKIHSYSKYEGKQISPFLIQDVFESTEEITRQKYYKHNNRNTMAVTYPLFIKSGRYISILYDFQKYYVLKKYKNEGQRRKVARNLQKKYRLTLKEYKSKVKKAKSKKGSKRKKTKRKKSTPKIWKNGDLDFVFLGLFNNIVKTHGNKVSQTYRSFLNDSWLYKYKKDINIYRKNRNQDKINAAQKNIKRKLNLVYKHLLSNRLIGCIIIIYNADQLTNTIEKTLTYVAPVAFSFIIIGLILTILIVNLSVSNLKKIEKSALEISKGNFNNIILVDSIDEVGRLSDIINNMTFELKHKLNLEKYVSKSTSLMVRDSAEAKSNYAELVALFSDVRGFTKFSEDKDPQAVIKILNDYFNLQAEVIKKYKGEIDNIVGDEIIAFFKGPHKIDNALKCAVQIQKNIFKFNRNRTLKNISIFHVGIGVHVGNVILGNMGSNDRKVYTAIGDTINLASRLCSTAKKDEIIVSKEIRKQHTTKFKIQKLKLAELKGKSKKVLICKLIYKK